MQVQQKLQYSRIISSCFYLLSYICLIVKVYNLLSHYVLMRYTQGMVISAFALLLIDQATKFLAQKVSNPFVFFSPNRGAVLTLWSESNTLILVISALVLCIVFYIFTQVDTRMQRGLVFVLAGLFSNFVDRVLFGTARDFLSFGYFQLFNIADIYVVLGILYITTVIIFQKDTLT